MSATRFHHTGNTHGTVTLQLHPMIRVHVMMTLRSRHHSPLTPRSSHLNCPRLPRTLQAHLHRLHRPVHLKTTLTPAPPPLMTLSPLQPPVGLSPTPRSPCCRQLLSLIPPPHSPGDPAVSADYPSDSVTLFWTFRIRCHRVPSRRDCY